VFVLREKNEAIYLSSSDQNLPESRTALGAKDGVAFLQRFSHQTYLSSQKAGHLRVEWASFSNVRKCVVYASVTPGGQI
jgi:hypothetical protein